MKKIFIFLLLCFIGAANAQMSQCVPSLQSNCESCQESDYSDCRCSKSICEAYDGVVDDVDEVIQDQMDAIDKLIDEIKKNTDDVTEQNNMIEKIIEAEKRKAVQNEHIVFLLKKIMELKTAGEH
jgi:type I site-specific restriction endonuclease